MLTEKDIKQITSRGSSLDEVNGQIERFKIGFPWMKIVAPATPENGGIQVLNEAETEAAIKFYEAAHINGKCKFVPASGAASRMFKDMFKGLSTLEGGKNIEDDSPAGKFVDNIKNFAFYDKELFGEPDKTAETRRAILSKTLTDEGLGYGAKPKGVLKFHRYADEIRTAFAEHLVEAQDYMRNSDDTANLMVTISPEHKELFEAALAEVKDEYEKKYGVKYNIEFTYQDKGTDTIAVDLDNKPFRTEEDTLLFRPAGHGALIHNLNNVKEEVVSIKNIDNVSVERLHPVTAKYKKVLLGRAIMLRDTIFGYLRELDAATGDTLVNNMHLSPELPGYTATYDEIYMTPTVQSLCNDIEEFLEKELCIKMPAAKDCKDRVMKLRAKLNRPIRVCGMVKNEGEPGGGPFIIQMKDGSTSLQILESVQINMSDETARAALASATHFNPVDLVCCLHDYHGNSFNLSEYVDNDAGFMSSKSYQGRELKALELPGLWNGAMSDWNTIFVEVPLETFNPVKVVLDLLRPAHQA